MMFYYVLKIMTTLYLRLKFKIDVIGIENIPKTGSLIIAANHVSNYDPVIIICLFQRKIHFLAKMELFKYTISNWFFKNVYAIPINRKSGNVIRSVRHSLSLLYKCKVLGIFPEGKRVRNNENVKPKNGVGYFALKSQAPITPIALIGINEKKIFRQPIKVIIGPTIKVNDLTKKNYSELAQYVMDEIEKLKSTHYLH